MAREIWDLEYRFPLSWAGRRILEPRWVRRMAGGRIVANSPSTAADLAEYHLTCQAATAAPGWDGEALAVARSGPSLHPRLLFLGRLVRHKRPGDALDAFRRVRHDFPEARLDVVGDGYLRGDLEKQAEPGVTIHGHVSEDTKSTLLDAADLILIPGTREGWGIVAIEAASRGVPVVAYNVPGLRDSVADGMTGVLCSPDSAAMADAATGLLRDPSRWRAMAEAGPSWARQFTWEKAAAVIMDALRRPLPTGTGASANR
jgi:glycosyltransferase involved in cell wall biosynthesis